MLAKTDDAEFELPLPLGGVSDDKAHSKQAPGTTPEAFNNRSQDPTNGRERPSQRAGMSKANDVAVQDGVKVAELVSTVFDARNVEYSFTPGAESVEWSKLSEKQTDSVPMGVTDDQGNVYIVDSATSVMKLNADGAIVWQLPLPVQDTSHSIRFIHVDDLGDVYVGVSAGSRQGLGRLWKLRQLPEDEIEVRWEVALNAYVETAKVHKDKLYTIQNEPDNARAYVRVYSSLDAIRPRLIQEWPVPFPANDMDVSTDGDVFVASPPVDAEPNPQIGTERSPNPKFPRFSQQMRDWTPFKIDGWEKRIWSWYKASRITEFDVAGPFVEGAKILRWPDISGHGRHLYAPTSIGKQPPTISFGAMGVSPVVRFNGVDQALISASNSSIQKAYADQQKTALPAYVDSMFLTIIVVRPEKRDSGSPMFVFGQDNSAAGATDHILVANRLAGAGFPGTFAKGKICHIATTAAGDPGQGAGNFPLEGSFDNVNDTVIVAILWDGGISPADTTKTRSLFQDNGFPRDRYQGLANTTLEPTILGWWSNPSSGIDHLKGDVVEWITFDRINRDSLTEPKVVTHDHYETGGPATAQTDNELTRLVGYLAHEYGLQHLLPPEPAANAHPYGQQQPVLGALGAQAAAGPPDDGVLGASGRAERAFGLLSKYNPQGELVWVASGEDFDPDDPLKSAVGFGYGVRCDKDGNVFSMGPTFPLLATIDQSTRFLRKIIDKGDTFSLLVADGAWSVVIDEPTYAYPRMDVDSFGNVYVPLSVGTDRLRVYKGLDGTLLSQVAVGVPPRRLFSVAIDRNIPDYGEDLADPIARFVYAFGQAGSDPSLQVTKVRLVQESPISGSPREHAHLAISGQGEIRKYELGGGSMSTPSGAVGALSSSAVYIQAASAFERIVITDGISKLKVYDPRLDTISSLASTTPGEPPHGCKILEFWAGRLVGLRAPGLINGAFNWLMSAVDDIADWNTLPVDGGAASAIGGSNAAGPGMVPDIPNAFIPYSDDFAYVGCDHSIYSLSGNPRDGGQWDLLSDITGIAFGRAWCKDPEGNVWFIGARGGLFVINPGGLPKRVSEFNIDQRLATINFATHYLRLAWNDDDKGVHILRFPFGTPGAPVEHWFWDRKRMAPWPDTFGSAADPSVEPTAVYVVDGDDPDDRKLLLGGRDGFIRKWDKDARDDDGVAIDWNVLVGPLADSSVRGETRFVGPRIVMASEQDGASFELFSTDDPSARGVVRHRGELLAGRNPLMRNRMRGSYCYVRVRNSLPGQRGAIEEAWMRAYPAGAKRMRETL